MAVPVKKKVKVIKAEYVKDVDSILIVGECDEGRFRNQINSSCFTFGNKDREEEMKKTAALMVGKTIWTVFDSELEDKIQDKYPLKY